MAVALMPPPKKCKAAGGRPRSSDPKRSLASIKGGKAYEKWLVGLARFAHLPITILIEHALREYAERHGYPEKQPDR